MLDADETIRAKLADARHPYGLWDREADRPMSMLDFAEYVRRCGGPTGKLKVAIEIERLAEGARA